MFEAVRTAMEMRLVLLYPAVLDAVQRVFAQDRYMRVRCWLVIAKVRLSLVQEFVPQMLEDAEALEDSNWYAMELLSLMNSFGDIRIASFLKRAGCKESSADSNALSGLHDAPH